LVSASILLALASTILASASTFLASTSILWTSMASLVRLMQMAVEPYFFRRLFSSLLARAA
jgi:hypothetical protein